jgi:hypothetical protein
VSASISNLSNRPESGRHSQNDAEANERSHREALACCQSLDVSRMRSRMGVLGWEHVPIVGGFYDVSVTSREARPTD